MTKELTAMQYLGVLSSEASELANKARDSRPPLGRNTIDMASYRDGEAIAYNRAHRLMTEELRRLRNLWQNNALSFDDFGVH